MITSPWNFFSLSLSGHSWSTQNPDRPSRIDHIVHKSPFRLDFQHVRKLYHITWAAEPTVVGSLHSMAFIFGFLSFVAAVAADSLLQPWPIRMDSTYETSIFRRYIFGVDIEFAVTLVLLFTVILSVIY